jgi:hypothetical protein
MIWLVFLRAKGERRDCQEEGGVKNCQKNRNVSISKNVGKEAVEYDT